MEKQLDFEQKRIYIKEVNQKDMIISGGSQFNWLSIIDDNQPLTIPAPILTEFIYTYKFEIIQNNKLLTEIEFLSVIGLKKKAQQIIDDYNSEIKIWENAPLMEYTKGAINYKDSFYNGAFAIGLYLFNKGLYPNTNYWNPALGFFTGWYLFKSFFILTITESVPYYDKPPRPYLKQSLSNDQIMNLAESYNKKIYSDISKK